MKLFLILIIIISCFQCHENTKPKMTKEQLVQLFKNLKYHHDVFQFKTRQDNLRFRKKHEGLKNIDIFFYIKSGTKNFIKVAKIVQTIKDERLVKSAIEDYIGYEPGTMEEEVKITILFSFIFDIPIDYKLETGHKIIEPGTPEKDADRRLSGLIHFSLPVIRYKDNTIIFIVKDFWREGELLGDYYLHFKKKFPYRKFN